MDELNLRSLKKAVAQLKRILSYTDASAFGSDDDFTFVVQTASIKAFEYCYELALKMMKRHVTIVSPEDMMVDAMNYRDFIRVASEFKIIDRPQAWFNFREDRNVTVHAYDEKKADGVFADLPGFLIEVEHVLASLEAMHDPSRP